MRKPRARPRSLANQVDMIRIAGGHTKAIANPKRRRRWWWRRRRRGRRKDEAVDREGEERERSKEYLS